MNRVLSRGARASGVGVRRRVLALAGVVVLAALACGCRDRGAGDANLPRFEAPAGEPPRIALVLGSGGPRGFAHIGVLKALEEMGIRPDVVVGASVGAMVATLYGAGRDGARLERLAGELSMLRFYELRQLLGRPGTGEPIESFVDETLGGRPLEALAPHVVVAATRRSDGKLVLFNHGDAGLAVRASAASPGDYLAVKVGEETYVDADEASPVPIRAARALGARFVIAVDVSAYPESTPAGVPAEWIAKDARRARQVRAEAPGADVLLHPDIGYYAGHSKEYRRRVMDIAERYTREQAPRIRAALVTAGLGREAPRAGEI